MCGRAGRTGKDDVGESILVCDRRHEKAVFQLINSDLSPLTSCLDEGALGLKRGLLDVIASGVAQSVMEMEMYVQCSLLAQQRTQEQTQTALKAALDFLLRHHFIEPSAEVADVFFPSLLGTATFSSGLSPDEAVRLYRDLSQAQRGLSLHSPLHLCYLLAPIVPDIEPPWPLFFQVSRMKLMSI